MKFLIRLRYERQNKLNKTPFRSHLDVKATKASTKIMKKTLTAHQQKMQREYDRMLSVIEHAKKGQQSMRPMNGEYSEFQHAAYKTYQAHIDAAECRIKQLKEEARDYLTATLTPA